MNKMVAIIDTNVLYTGLKSSQGASFRLLSLIPSKKFIISVSVPLVVEYEDVLKRPDFLPHLTGNDIDDFLDFIVSVADKREVHYLWRPFLKDQCDDMILELAVASSADVIITYNKRDFKKVEETFGIKVLDAKEFLEKIGELK